MMTLTKVFILLLPITLISCSTNFGRYDLMEQFEIRKSKSQNGSNTGTVLINGNNYILPVQIKIELKNSKTIEGVLLDVANDPLESIYNIKNTIGEIGTVSNLNIKTIEVFSSPVQKENIKEKTIDIYFSPNEVTRNYKIVYFYHWKFLAFPPFLTTEMIITTKSVFKHWQNAINLNGDGVIIDPGLTHSTVIKYLD